jgi:hypothetical protein
MTWRNQWDVPLTLVRDDVNFYARRALCTAGCCRGCLQAAVDNQLEIALETLAEVLEHSGTSR